MEVIKDQLYTGFNIIKEYNVDSPEDIPTIKLQGKFGSANEQNGNGRKYKKETIVDKIVNFRTSEDKLKSNPLFGEAIHPNDDLTGEINPEKITHKINWTKMVGDDLYGEIQLIPETPLGKVMHTLVDKYGAVPGISSRAFGKMSGSFVDHDSYRYITHDLTFNPSTPNAFLNKVRESTEIQSILKECSDSELKTINESLSSYGINNILKESKDLDDEEENKKKKEDVIKDTLSKGDYDKLPDKDKSNYKWDDKKELYLKIKESNINKNKLIMEERIEKLTKEVSKLSEQIGSLTKENESLTESVKTKEADVSKLEESKDKLKGFYEKSLAVVEGLRNKLIILRNENSVLNSNYEKCLAVAESLTDEFNKVKGHYSKALKVIEGVRSNNIENAIFNLVEKELGDGASTKYENIFKDVGDLEKASVLIKAIKEAAANEGPTKFQSLRERSGETSGVPVNTDPAFEAKVDLYS
jgi:cell division protein FtsB